MAGPSETKPAEAEKKNEQGDSKKEDEKTGKKEEPVEQDLSDEDKQLQEELNMLVERLQEDDTKLYKPALEQLRSLIKASTSSMTSVPKPLKFLRPHYKSLKEIYEKIKDAETKRFCADIVSVLGMTISEERECLQYRLLGSKEDIASWGHEYVRHLAEEIAQDWNALSLAEMVDEQRKDQLLALVMDIIPYQMNHNAECEACDLLMEIERLDLLEKHVDENAFPRVCLYLTSCVSYVAEPEDSILLRTAKDIFLKFTRYPEALRCAIQLKDSKMVEEIFKSCDDKLVQKQLAFMLGRQQLYLELDDSEVDGADELTEIISNTQLNNNFLNLARELDIMEPKTPEDIYKSHLEPSRPSFGASHVDSAKQNLAASFVNGFVNAGFGHDKLVTEDGNKWMYKNKEHGMFSAAASLGLVLLWDVDGGLTQIDKYLYSTEDNIKAGALLACGIVNCGVKNECDPALALLTDFVKHSSVTMRIGAVLGLGLAYAGSCRSDVVDILVPVLDDSKSTTEVLGVTAIALGLICVGSCDADATTNIIKVLMEKSEADKDGTDLKDTHLRFLALGLGLLHLGKQDTTEALMVTLDTLKDPLKSVAKTTVEICAYAGTGNVLKIQHLLHICSEHYEATEKEEKKEKKKENKEGSKEGESEVQKSDLTSQQAVAVLGIALISMGEEIGSEMVFRTMGHLLRYGEPCIRRVVPLALSLTAVSNPRLNVLDTLSKFSHDSDVEVAYSAIFAMGIVGAGTNNARLGALLRQLAVYHSKDPSCLFMVRLAQGLVHCGKGTLALTPYHSDRQLMSPTALAGILVTLTGFMDCKNLILGKAHYLLYCLVPAIHPRLLVTFDTDLNPLSVSVRVGQAVDVVGQAGKPKAITGFQTHTTPVLLAYGERAELATDEYLALTPVLEGFVILKKNPDAAVVT